MRESSRLQALAPSAGQPSLHLPTRYNSFEVKTLTEHPACRPLFGLTADEKFAGNQALDEARRAASPIAYLTADAPPISMTYGEPRPVTETSNPSLWGHHGALGVKLKEHMDALGIESHLRLGRGANGSQDRSATEFLREKLSGSRLATITTENSRTVNRNKLTQSR